MFIWPKINYAEHPGVVDNLPQNLQPPLDDNEDEVYQKALEEGVMTCKGSIFMVRLDDHKAKSKTCVLEVHFRHTFTIAKSSEVQAAISILLKAVRTSFPED